MKDEPAPYAEMAERLRAAQEALNLSAKDFAENAGLSRTQMSNWQSGQVRISLDGAMALRETYALSIDFIVAGNMAALPHKLAMDISSILRSKNSQ